MHALHYSPVKIPANTGQIFGLQVAIQDLVRAWFRYGTQEKFNILVGEKAGQDEIEELAREAGLTPARLALLDQRYGRDNFPRFETIFRAEPDTKKLLWQRQNLSHPRFAFCGLSHAMSGEEGGAVLEQYCLAPSTDSDAIICPSRALASAIRAFWDNYATYLNARFKIDYRCPVQLPVIPLGIDIEKFAARVSADRRAAQRAALGLNDNDTVLLWVGRLSHAIKAHPLAMFQTAERAAELTGASVHLIMQGYFVPPEAQIQFAKLARDVCQKARVTFVAPNDPRFPDGLWAAGDIFLSLIDNMQESFGLTPIEAMAAGLPRVLSDWDGYRDSVQNGEDGFLVRTTTPPPGAGQALADLLLDGREVYGGFLGKTALCTAVDYGMAAAAIKLLIENKEKYRAVADKARARVREFYDWRHIIPAYEALWCDLAARRRPSGDDTKWPLAPDPFTMYATYASSPLTENDRLRLAASTDMIRLLLSDHINAFGLDMMVPVDAVTQLINYIATHDGVAVRDIFVQFPSVDRAQIWRSLGWLLKLGILRR